MNNPSHNYRVFAQFQEIMNFTYILEIPKDKEWGVINDDGLYTGMVGRLQDKEIDIGNSMVVAILQVNSNCTRISSGITDCDTVKK